MYLSSKYSFSMGTDRYFSTKISYSIFLYTTIIALIKYVLVYVKGIWVCALSLLFSTKHLESNKPYLVYLYDCQLSFQYI